MQCRGRSALANTSPTPSKTLDFYFFFASGYAYLSVMRIEEMAASTGVSVNLIPVQHS